MTAYSERRWTSHDGLTRLAKVPNVGHAQRLTGPEAVAAIAEFLGSVP